MINMGTDHVWEGCGLPFSPPGFDPFFGGGNERTLVHYTGPNFNSGYYISPNDSFILYNELMNMDVEEKHIYATINWEYLPGKPEGFKRVQDMWLDLSYCSPVGRKAPANEKTFNVSSVKWTSPYDGQVVSICKLSAPSVSIGSDSAEKLGICTMAARISGITRTDKFCATRRPRTTPRMWLTSREQTELRDTMGWSTLRT